MTSDDPPILPAHIEQTIGAIAELHRQHNLRATPTEHFVARMTGTVARPRFVGVLSVVLFVWLGANVALHANGKLAIDPPPFNLLQAVTGIAGVYITILILITQRRENELSEARDQLTLELAILNEQKSAKIIALLEELRRDLPFLPNRKDQEADALAVPADPQAVLDALRNTTLDAPSPESGPLDFEGSAAPVGDP